MDNYEVSFKIETLEEVEVNLVSLFTLLERLKGGSHISNEIDELFRIIHSVKGNLRSADFELLSNFVHKTEEVLFSIKEDNSKYGQQIFDFLFLFHEGVTEFVINLKNDINFKIDSQFLENKLEKIFEADNASNKLKFLVVDDEEDIVLIIKEQLMSLYSCDVSAAYNGEEALKLCSKNKFDAILTDYSMPNLNGEEFICNIRKANPQNFNTPVLLITAYRPDFLADEKVWDKVFFVQKPFTEKSFRFVLKCALNNKVAA